MAIIAKIFILQSRNFSAVNGGDLASIKYLSDLPSENVVISNSVKLLTSENLSLYMLPRDFLQLTTKLSRLKSTPPTLKKTSPIVSSEVTAAL